jgi:hypothetical protein
VKPALLILGVAVAANAAILVITRINSPRRTHVEIEKTPAQLRAAKEAEERALLPAPPAAVLPAVQNPAATLATVTGASATTDGASSPAPQPAPPGPPAATLPKPGPSSRRLRVASSAPAPVIRRRSLDISTATTFADALAGGGSAAAPGALPRGTLIPARLLASADANNPGPVTAAVTKDVEANGATVIPEGSTLICAATGPTGNLPRVAITCDSVTINGQSVRLSGMALGADQGRGIPVGSSGGPASTEPARGGAISTGARVASQFLGADGIAGELVDGAVRAGEQTAQSATRPRLAALEPAPKGTRFFVFVSSFGGAP